MSLAINPDQVRGVLLADGWHTVAEYQEEEPISTFALDAYEYVTPHPVADRDPLIQQGDETLGFAFQDADGGQWVYGPLSSVIAVRTVR